MQDIHAVLSFELLRLGGSTITLGGVVTAIVIVSLAALVAALISGTLRRIRMKHGRRAAALYVVEKISTYGLIVIGVIAGLSTMGLNLSSLAVFAGALGVGVGLGLQGVVKEFVSGLFLIFDRMLNVGDYVELESGIRGVVTEIGTRATRIRTNDNINILVPNSRLIDNAVTNWTLKGDTRRIHIPFSVAYGADREKVRDAVIEAARNVPFTLPEDDTHKTQVWLVRFGDSSLDFELLVWPTLEAVKRPAAMQAAYTWAIAEALDHAGIEIPFPQMDLRLRSLFGHEGDGALEALGLQRAPPPKRKPARSSRGGGNDAADDLLKHAEREAQAEAAERVEDAPPSASGDR